MDKNQELVFRAKNFRKQKELGQCFLVDNKILDRIIETSNPDPNKDIVVEIGAGIGFLTERLVEKCKSLYAVELDPNTEMHLKIIAANHPNFKYFRKDFLSLNLQDILSAEDLASGRKIKIIANIPYQITTKILLHLLGEIGEANPNRELISEIHIMVQKEFAERLCSQPGSKNFGAISLFINYWTDPSISIQVPASCFLPAPKVNSCFIKLVLKKPIEVKEPKELRRFIRAIYANRRKKLKNGLRAFGYSEENIEKLNLQDNLRGETLDLEEIIDIVQKLRE